MLRKLISLALCMILCVTAVVFPVYAEETAPAARITKIQKAVEEGGDKALWDLVNTHYATNTYMEEGCAELHVWSPDSPVFAHKGKENEHVINSYWVNMMETADVGFNLEQIITCTVEPDGTCTVQDVSQDMLPLGPVHIAPGYTLPFRVNKTADGTGRYEIIAAAGTDDNGHELEFYGVIQMLNSIPAESSETAPSSPDYDIDTLRHDAEFQMIVSDDVWWVPVSELGKSRYTNWEIAGMVEDSPEQKQEEISTLYEAVQLFKISGFTYTEDNVNIPENGISWEHHKPGRDAVRTNTGCCAADTNWLNYILDGDYEQAGFIAYSMADGNGHVFNYIYQDGYYYFIDLTGYEEESVDALACESGLPRDFINSVYTGGCLLKAKTPEAFVKYFATSRMNAPSLFFVYQAENVLPVQGRDVDGVITMTYPEGYDIKVIEGSEPEKLGVQFVEGPRKSYKWEALKDAKYKVKDKYLRSTDESDIDPLTAYKPGDILTLEDNSDKGRAVIDGIKFSTSKRDEVRIGFEDNVYLDGEHANGVFDLSLPMEKHGEAIRDMNSLVLGELNIGIVRTIPETQIVICTREGNQLTVQEVMDGRYYDSRQISIRKDENGNWMESECWCLIITRDRKVKYEFGRIHCGIKN